MTEIDGDDGTVCVRCTYREVHLSVRFAQFSQINMMKRVALYCNDWKKLRDASMHLSLATSTTCCRQCSAGEALW